MDAVKSLFRPKSRMLRRASSGKDKTADQSDPPPLPPHAAPQLSGSNDSSPSAFAEARHEHSIGEDERKAKPSFPDLQRELPGDDPHLDDSVQSTPKPMRRRGSNSAIDHAKRDHNLSGPSAAPLVGLAQRDRVTGPHHPLAHPPASAHSHPTASAASQPASLVSGSRALAGLAESKESAATVQPLNAMSRLTPDGPTLKSMASAISQRLDAEDRVVCRHAL